MGTDERTFTAPSGERWRAFQPRRPGDEGRTKPDRITAVAAQHKAELWFRSAGGERRVLLEFPRDWRALSEEALVRLWERASVIDQGPI